MFFSAAVAVISLLVYVPVISKPVGTLLMYFSPFGHAFVDSSGWMLQQTYPLARG